MIKVLVVDDHKLIRKGITSLLNSLGGFCVIAEACSGEEAIRMVREHQPDVVLMDLQMPGIGGLEATRKILHINPDVKILAITVNDSELISSRLLTAGASGYITKDCCADEMARAMRAVYMGQHYITSSVAQKLALKQTNNDEASLIKELSDRELQIMIMTAKGLRTNDIAKSLNLSPKTVSTHRSRLFKKLKIKSDVELTYLALRNGLVDV